MIDAGAIRVYISNLKLPLVFAFIVSNLAITICYAAEASTAAVTTGAVQAAGENAPMQNTGIATASAPSKKRAGGGDTRKCEPAVSHVNAWGSVSADYLHNQRTSGLGAFVEGGVAVPIVYNFAAQLHGIGGTNFQSIDGYAFWREPLQGLLGPHLLYTQSNDFRDVLYGLHGELYVENFTLTAEGGGTGITNGHHSNNIYYEAIVNWYAKPDWKFYIGGIVMGDGAVQLGTEYLFGTRTLPGLAMFADAGIGAHNLNYGFLGLRYYFNFGCKPCKSLIRRHREDMVPATLNPISRIKDTDT